jgi:hypothetical protein
VALRIGVLDFVSLHRLRFMIVLKSSMMSFAIYRHQAKIFVVLSDGPIEVAAVKFSVRQRVTVAGDY